MKKFSKLAVSGLLVLAMTMGLAMSAFAEPTEPTGGVGGDSDVDNIVFQVVVPTNLDFSIDPFELNETATGQINVAADFGIINKTAADVKVWFDLTATGNTTNSEGKAVPKEDFKFVDSPAKVFPDDDTVTNHDIFFAAIAATDVEGVVFTDETLAANAGEATYAKDGDALAGSLIPFAADDTASEATASFGFALGKATASDPEAAVDTLAASSDGVAAFKFYAQLNTYAGWDPEDIVITGTYKLTGIRNTTYGTYPGTEPGAADSKYNAYGLNLLKLAPAALPTTVGFIGADGVTTTTTLTEIPAGMDIIKGQTGQADVVIPFFFGEFGAEDLKVGYSPYPTFYFEEGLDYTVNVGANGVGSITFLRSNVGSRFFDEGALGEFTIPMTFEGDDSGTAYTLPAKVSAS